MRFLTREAFQSQTEAEEKWRRATLSQVQLVSYYDGYAEILRSATRKSASRQGFRVKDFNNRFLSYGRRAGASHPGIDARRD